MTGLLSGIMTAAIMSLWGKLEHKRELTGTFRDSEPNALKNEEASETGTQQCPNHECKMPVSLWHYFGKRIPPRLLKVAQHHHVVNSLHYTRPYRKHVEHNYMGGGSWTTLFDAQGDLLCHVFSHFQDTFGHSFSSVLRKTGLLIAILCLKPPSTLTH